MILFEVQPHSHRLTGRLSQYLIDQRAGHPKGEKNPDKRNRSDGGVTARLPPREEPYQKEHDRDCAGNHTRHFDHATHPTLAR